MFRSNHQTISDDSDGSEDSDIVQYLDDSECSKSIPSDSDVRCLNPMFRNLCMRRQLPLDLQPQKCESVKRRLVDISTVTQKLGSNHIPEVLDGNCSDGVKINSSKKLKQIIGAEKLKQKSCHSAGNIVESFNSRGQEIPSNKMMTTCSVMGKKISSCRTRDQTQSPSRLDVRNFSPQQKQDAHLHFNFPRTPVSGFTEQLKSDAAVEFSAEADFDYSRSVSAFDKTDVSHFEFSRHSNFDHRYFQIESRCKTVFATDGWSQSNEDSSKQLEFEKSRNPGFTKPWNPHGPEAQSPLPTFFKLIDKKPPRKLAVVTPPSPSQTIVSVASVGSNKFTSFRHFNDSLQGLDTPERRFA